jgi:two-component system nitrate/nitrite response regulator NarL
MRRQHSFATIIIGKNALIREGIARILREANFRTAASLSCADDFAPGTLQLQQLLFIVVHTGDDFDVVLEQVVFLRDTHPGGRIAIVADHYRLDELVSAFRAGTNGYFVDVMTCDVFIKSIELLMMGETIFPPAFLSSILCSEIDHFAKAAPRNDNNRALAISAERNVTQQLSPREQSIMQCLIAGDSDKCIARKIDIAEATVKVHVKAILRRIRVQNRTQAAIWGMNHGSQVPPISDVADTSEQFRGSLPIVCNIKQIEGLVPPELINPPTNGVEAPSMGRLIRNGTARFGK